MKRTSMSRALNFAEKATNLTPKTFGLMTCWGQTGHKDVEYCECIVARLAGQHRRPLDFRVVEVSMRSSSAG